MQLQGSLGDYRLSEMLLACPFTAAWFMLLTLGFA